MVRSYECLWDRLSEGDGGREASGVKGYSVQGAYTYKIGYPKEGRSQGLVLCRDTREQDSCVFFTADVAT